MEPDSLRHNTVDLSETRFMASTSFDNDADLQPGHQIERYEVVRRLGAGAMAAVYLVEHTQLGTPYALKVLTISRSRQFKQRMVQEGRNQAKLAHENTVRVFDVLHIDGMPALIMEYVKGCALDEWLDENRPSLDETERIFRGIVAGVAAAHEAGLVHRDLKPANIMMKDAPEGPIPKVADFGLAKAWADDSVVSHTRAGLAMGTPQYMAPEQATNAKDVDHRADIFALGCILYELVCGKQAFPGDNLPTIFNRILAGDYVRAHDLDPDLPERFRHTIEGCLLTDVDQRLQSCDEVLAALSGDTVAHADSQPSLHRRAPLGEGTAPKVPMMLGGMVGVAGLLLGSLLLAFVFGGGAFWYFSDELSLLEDMVQIDEDAPEQAPDDEVTPVEEPVEEAPAPSAPDAPCAHPDGEVVGYANVRGVFLFRQGAVWYPLKAQAVMADYPRPDNNYKPSRAVQCKIPSSSPVRLLRDPIKVKGQGYWIPIVGGSVG